MLVALDLAPETGWAAGVPGGQPVSGMFTLLAHEGRGNAFIRLRSELDELIGTFRPVLVAFEAPLFKHDDYVRFAMGAAAHVESTCADFDIKTRAVSVSKARSTVLGRTSWGGETREERTDNIKRAVVHWAREQGYDPVDHNAADALVIWRFLADQMTRRRAA